MRKSVEWLSGTAQPLYNFLHWLDDQIYLLSERFWCQVNSLLQWNQICDGTDICWTVFSLSGTVYTDRTSQSIISGQYSVRASLCCTTSSTSPQPARRSLSQEYFLHLVEWRVRSVGGPLSLLDWGGEFLFWHKVCCCLSDGSWFICHNIPLFVIKLEYRQSLQRTTEIRK